MEPCKSSALRDGTLLGWTGWPLGTTAKHLNLGPPLLNPKPLPKIHNLGSFRNLAKLDKSSFNLGLKQILSETDISTRILRRTYPEAVEMVRATIIKYPQKLHAKLRTILKKSSSNSMPIDYTLLQVVREYGDKIELTESDGKPRTSKKKGKRKSSNGFTVKERRVDYIDSWELKSFYKIMLLKDLILLVVIVSTA
ncbi:hypothetical protein Tco_0687462, partial [Tanacetum coccineum]